MKKIGRRFLRRRFFPLAKRKKIWAFGGKVAAFALLFICLDSVVSPINLAALMETRLSQDDTISAIVRRYQCLQGHLPGNQIIGYHGAVDNDVMNWQLLNYALPPYNFAESQGMVWMVINLPDQESALQEMSSFSGYRVIHDCKNGILLIKRQE